MQDFLAGLAGREHQRNERDAGGDDGKREAPDRHRAGIHMTRLILDVAAHGSYGHRRFPAVCRRASYDLRRRSYSQRQVSYAGKS